MAKSRVSVRALHHYDEIGLLVPSGRTAAGYRLYDEADVLRLQQILIGRELGLSLEQIRQSLDDPTFDRKIALRAQRRELEARRDRATQMVAAIDAALKLLSDDKGVDTMDLATIFDGLTSNTKLKQRPAGARRMPTRSRSVERRPTPRR